MHSKEAEHELYLPFAKPRFSSMREIAIAVRSANTREAHDGRKRQKLVDLSKMIRETGTRFGTAQMKR